MFVYIAAAANTVTVVTVIVVLSIRLEHRITKVETDVNWLKCYISENFGKG